MTLPSYLGCAMAHSTCPRTYGAEMPHVMPMNTAFGSPSSTAASSLLPALGSSCVRKRRQSESAQRHAHEAETNVKVPQLPAMLTSGNSSDRSRAWSPPDTRYRNTLGKPAADKTALNVRAVRNATRPLVPQPVITTTPGLLSPAAAEVSTSETAAIVCNSDSMTLSSKMPAQGVAGAGGRVANALTVDC